MSPAGLTTVSTRNASPLTIIWVTGGAEGAYYTLTNTIVTNQSDPVSGLPRQKQRSIGITVRFQ